MNEGTTTTMPSSISFWTFVWAVIVGMGLRIGWGLIELIVMWAGQALKGS